MSADPNITEGHSKLASTVRATESVNGAVLLDEDTANYVTTVAAPASAGNLPLLSVASMVPKKPLAVNVAAPLEEHITTSMQKLISGTGRNPIEIGFTIYSVTKIDPVEQSFMCDLKIFCRWHDGGMEADPDMCVNKTLYPRPSFQRSLHPSWMKHRLQISSCQVLTQGAQPLCQRRCV